MLENRLPGERPDRHPAAGTWERTVFMSEGGFKIANWSPTPRKGFASTRLRHRRR
jgi:hypothetical protein